MAKFLPNAKISDVHGQAAWVKGRLVAPMYHPAAALHQPSLKPALEKDFMRLPEFIKQAKTAQQAAQPPEKKNEPEKPPEKPKDEPTQLSLF